MRAFVSEKFKSKGDVKADVGKMEAKKGVWWMPWLSEATKDVISCEKLRVGANIL